MVTAIIFAGGTGQRMNSKSKPKQFLELHGKSIILYTIENFEYHNEIDNIIVVCLDGWINTLKEQLERFNITKVSTIVSGGDSGQASIYNGLKEAHKQSKSEKDIVLIHDGVRPFVSNELISKNIESVKKYGSAITVVPAKEGVMKVKYDRISKIYRREKLAIAKAPQSFHLTEIWKAHNKAIEENKNDFADSAELMNEYGYKLNTIIGSEDNIKITTAYDFYIFRAIYEAKENSQIYGI